MRLKHVVIIAALIIVAAVTTLLLWHSRFTRFTRFAGEAFTDTSRNPKYDVFTTNGLQHSPWITERKWKVRSVPFEEKEWKKTAKALMSADVRSKYTGNPYTALLADPHDASNVWENLHKNKKIQIPQGYFVILTGLGTALQLECSYNFLDKNVGFLDRSDELFLKAVIRGYRIPTDRIRVQQVPMSAWDHLEEQLQRLDMIVCYLVPGSPFHKLLQTQDISVMGFKNIDIDRIKLFYPYVQLKDVDFRKILLDVPGSALKIMDREKETQVPTMTMQLLHFKDDETREGFISRLDVHEEEADPSYRCYGDLTVEQKALCDSPYDPSGLKKRKQTVWDRPCITDDDCPFFKANKNYHNHRGGCLKDGVCEFPIGIKRIAFRKYDDKGVNAPFCYQCQNSSDPSCCDHQKKSWVFSSPDYAFVNDTAQRKKAFLPTAIGSLS